MPKLWKRYTRLHDLMLREEGQDLIEYAMVVALIALTTTAAMRRVQPGVSTQSSLPSARS
jgi:Flp pilus assembly pilin Flp